MKIGIIGLTFLIMFTAKVFGFTDWSWWVVTAPVWGLPFIALALIISFLVLVALSRVVEWAVDRLLEGILK